MSRRGASLIELLVAVSILGVLAALLLPAFRSIRAESSLALSASSIRNLGVGMVNHLADNKQTFWRYRQDIKASDPEVSPGGTGTAWWFGFESDSSRSKRDGQRWFEAESGPLGGYVPARVIADPSFGLSGRTLRPKYKSGYFGIGYNIHLGGGWMGTGQLKRLSELSNPAKVAVFVTSAQIAPGTDANPLIEEFYGFNDGSDSQATIHFRHHGKAMVGFADGNAGFLPINETTRDKRAPQANIGRFAPRLSRLYLE